MSALLAVAILALVVLTCVVVYAARAVVSYTNEARDTGPPQAEPSGDPVHGGSEWYRLSDRMDRLEIAVSEGISRVDRHEKRIRKTVTSARRLVRDAGLEHAGIDAEFEQLQPPDDEGIEPLSAVPQEVEPPRTVRIPGGEFTIGVA